MASGGQAGDRGDMGSAHPVPPRPRYRSEAPTQERLVDRNEALRKSHARALAEVGKLAETQEEMGRALSDELASLSAQGEAVEQLQDPGSQGLLDNLVRRFTRRRQLLARRSATEELVDRYEAVSTRLRRASAFTDELRLTALELQDEVQALHREIDDAAHDERLAAERVLALEEAIEALRSDRDAPDRDRLLDTLRFELRQQGQVLELYRTTGDLCRQHLEPARALRDTVQKLQEEMQAFVLAATGQVDAAGRRIQALGAAADAPIVVGELQESLAELQEAMRATETYLSQTRDLIAHTLPELSRQITAEAATEHWALTHDLDALDRARTRASAERALREAAWREIQQLGEER